MPVILNDLNDIQPTSSLDTPPGTKMPLITSNRNLNKLHGETSTIKAGVPASQTPVIPKYEHIVEIAEKFSMCD